MPSGYISHLTNPKDYFRTAPGFEVNMLGEVRKAYGLKEQLPVEMIDGLPCVFTGQYWRFKRSPRPGFNAVADIVALNYKPTLIPLPLIDKISAYPRDGNELNLHPSNLVWKYAEPLEVPWVPGYFYIPGYTRYAISREGSIIRVEDVKQMDVYPSQVGYMCCSLEADNPRVRTLSFRYVASALAFLDYPVTIADLVVNHKDGTKDNDHPDNLEWIDTAENLRHGVIHKALGFPPPDYAYKIDYYSVDKTLELFKANGIKPPVAVKTPVVPTKRAEEPSEEAKAKDYYDRSNFRNIKIKRLDILTRDIVVFENRQAALKESDILDNQLYQSLNSPLFEEAGFGLVKGQWIFRYEHMGFPEITPLFVLNATQSGGTRRSVVFKNTASGLTAEFAAVREGCAQLGLIAGIVFKTLSQGKQAVPGTHWLVKFKDSLKDWEA